MRNKILIVVVLIFLAGFADEAHAQLRRSDQSAVTYEELFDDPYDINALFVHFQPLYMELFTTNVNAGFGLKVDYNFKNKMEFSAQARKAYAKETDLARLNASKTSDMDNKPAVYNYYELGATYHIKDWEEDSQSKVILYSKRYKGAKWAANVPEHIIIPTKVRKIYGARLGGLIYDSSTDLSRIIEKQQVVLPEVGDGGSAIPGDNDIDIYGNVNVMGIYLGGSMRWIKNFAIKPDRSYGTLGNDLIFTTYLDFIFAPAVEVQNVFMDGIEYSSENIKTSKIGFRAGMEGKFNRELGWAYGAELGVRPGIKTRGFYALLKISFPVFSTNLDYGKEAFGK